MLISDESQKERQYITGYARELAAKWTEEQWKVRQCKTFCELEKIVESKEKTDIACVDITMEGALELTKQLRQKSAQAYIILIADTWISPLAYMRPSVGAESLMLKPLTKEQIRQVLEEAIGTYVRRFYKPDEKKVFVLENKNGRELIAYDKICFFESREKKIYLNTEMEEYGFSDTLDMLEERLSDIFLRCHRSFLINKEKIRRVCLSQNFLMLEGEFEIPISRTCKPAVKEYLEERNR